MPLNFLGIDSLMAVELRNRIQADIHVTVTVAHLLQKPTISQLVDVLLEQLQNADDVPQLVPAVSEEGPGEPEEPSAAAAPSEESAMLTLDRIDELSDEEVAAMLGQMGDGQGDPQ